MAKSEETTLLIVEDDAELCATVAAAAQEWAIQLHGRAAAPFSKILQRTSLDEGLRALELKPDVIMLDVRLGDRNGISLARAATRMSPVPLILATSGEASAGEAFALAQLGVRGYLAKPFDLIDLRSAIEAVAATPPELEPLASKQVGVHPIHTVQDGVKRAMLIEALSRMYGNYAHAGQLLGLSRQAIQQMAKNYELTEFATQLREKETT